MHEPLANERGVQSCSVATRTASRNLLLLVFATSDEMFYVAKADIICVMNTRAGAANQHGPSSTGFDTPPFRLYFSNSFDLRHDHGFNYLTCSELPHILRFSSGRGFGKWQ
jgi:hypothetical protein